MTPDSPILPPAEPDDSSSSIDIVEVVAVMWKQRKLITFFVGACTVLSIVVSLFLPEYYKSTATILPETDKGKLSSLGGLSDLASLAGVNVAGEGSSVKLYPSMIRSEAVLKDVILRKYVSKKYADSMDLIHFWKISEKTPQKDYEEALDKIRNDLSVFLDPRISVLTIAIETTEPQLSADIINAITTGLDRFIRTKRTTNASEQRKWIEARLAEVKQDLESAENQLRMFREANRMIIGSPNLRLEEERHAREVQINSTMYVELKKQFELVKIEEIRNTPIISVMDSAHPAASKERPSRRNIVIISLLISLACACGFVLVRESYGERVSAFANMMRQYVRVR